METLLWTYRGYYNIARLLGKFKMEKNGRMVREEKRNNKKVNVCLFWEVFVLKF